MNMAREFYEIGQRYRLSFGGQSGRVHEIRAYEAQIFRTLIHLLRESRFAARQPFSENDGTVICSLHNHALQQISNRWRRLDLSKHR